MKRLLAAIFLTIGLSLNAATTSNWVALITVTNTAGTTNGQNFVVAGNTRTWTNSVFVPASQILTNNTLTGAGVNMIAQVEAHAFTGFSLASDGSTYIKLTSAVNVAKPTCTISAGWGTLLVYSNLFYGDGTQVRMPIESEPSAAKGTNIMSAIASGLSKSTNAIVLSQVAGATNVFPTTIMSDPASGSFLQKRIVDGLTVGTFDASPLTNHVTWQVANYALATNDSFILLSGNHTATMPAPGSVAVMGRLFVIQCSSSGTNAILPNGSETFNGKSGIAAAKWTNSAIGNVTALYSNGTNWWIIHADN